jgi:hypothetical protein
MVELGVFETLKLLPTRQGTSPEVVYTYIGNIINCTIKTSTNTEIAHAMWEVNMASRTIEY